MTRRRLLLLTFLLAALAYASGHALYLQGYQDGYTIGLADCVKL